MTNSVYVCIFTVRHNLLSSLWLPACVYDYVYTASATSGKVFAVIAAVKKSWQRSLACNGLLNTATPSN